MYQEDLKLENYAVPVAHPPPGNRRTLCPVHDVFVASSTKFTLPVKCLITSENVTNKKRTPKSNPLLGYLISHTTLKTFWS
jgi:hypothetical protein